MENTFTGDMSELDAVAAMPIDNREVVAMAYVPIQKLETVYDPDQAYNRGTLFPQLDKPWLGGRYHE